ncbi:adenylyltransferase/cytidyltransferase family protein [Psittacicella melopsittaci]|uniref:adenylyltransferase/cytidyltransferase family protein n=1 Tax=Psittacicella melopsittaci TaxID=2028576 RepID=UPI001CA6ED67|nr:adenylyltransferase/cytidyltransferase family protein [Psittacicella melopsittaci]
MSKAKFNSKKINPVFAELITESQLEDLKLAYEESADAAYEQVHEHRRSYEPLDIENQVYIIKTLNATPLPTLDELYSNLKSEDEYNRKPKVGVIFGKFYPLHQGHLYMIDRARIECDLLYIFVCSDEKRDEKLFWDSSIPVQPTREVRTSWVKRATSAYDNVFVFNLREDNIPSYPNGWFEWAKVVDFYLGQLKYRPEYVYTSEPQDAENYKYHLNLEAILVDPSRDYVPISGTECRRNVFTNFNYLPEVVKADVVLNINLDIDDLLTYYGIDKNKITPELENIGMRLQHMCRNYGFNFCTPILDDFKQQKVKYSFANNGPVTVTWGNPATWHDTAQGQLVHQLVKNTETDNLAGHSEQEKAQALLQTIADQHPELATNIEISQEVFAWFNHAIGLDERLLTANAFNHYTVRVFSLQDRSIYQPVDQATREKNYLYAQEHNLPFDEELGVYFPQVTSWSLIRQIVQAQNNEYYVACALHNKFRYVEHLAPLYLGVTNYANLWHQELNYLPTGLNYKLSPGLSYKVGIAKLEDLEFAIVTVIRTLISRLQESLPHPYEPMILTRPSEQRMRRLYYCIKKLEKLTENATKLQELENLAEQTEATAKAANKLNDDLDLTAATAEQQHYQEEQAAKADAEEKERFAKYANIKGKYKYERQVQAQVDDLESEIQAYIKERELTGIHFLYRRQNPTDPVESKTYIFNRNQEDDVIRSKEAIRYLSQVYINWVDLYSFKLPGFGYITPEPNSLPPLGQRVKTKQREPRLTDKWVKED